MCHIAVSKVEQSLTVISLVDYIELTWHGVSTRWLPTTGHKASQGAVIVKRKVVLTHPQSSDWIHVVLLPSSSSMSLLLRHLRLSWPGMRLPLHLLRPGQHCPATRLHRLLTFASGSSPLTVLYRVGYIIFSGGVLFIIS
jgi:hypothetical protein